MKLTRVPSVNGDVWVNPAHVVKVVEHAESGTVRISLAGDTTPIIVASAVDAVEIVDRINGDW